MSIKVILNKNKNLLLQNIFTRIKKFEEKWTHGKSKSLQEYIDLWGFDTRFNKKYILLVKLKIILLVELYKKLLLLVKLKIIDFYLYFLVNSF